MSEWQPIETAPKDGTAMLVWAGMRDWLDNPVPSVAWYSRLHGWVGHFASGDMPSHWQPLPAPPATP